MKDTGWISYQIILKPVSFSKYKNFLIRFILISYNLEYYQITKFIGL